MFHRWHPGCCGLCFCAFPGMLNFVFATVAILAVRVKRVLRGSVLKLWAGTLLPRLLFPRALRGCTVCGDSNCGVRPLHRLKAVKWHTLQTAAAQEPGPGAMLNVLLAADAFRNIRWKTRAVLTSLQLGSAQIVELRDVPEGEKK